MSIQNSTSCLIIISIAFLLCSLTLFCFGKRMIAKGEWIVWLGIVFSFFAVLFDFTVFFDQQSSKKQQLINWIVLFSENDSFVLGLLQDRLSFIFSILSLAIVGILLFSRIHLLAECRPEKIYSAIMISVSGVILSFIALTPWMVLPGFFLILLGGGILLLSGGGDFDSEASVAITFFRGRSIGILIAFLGGCILATRSSTFFLNEVVSSDLKNHDQLLSTKLGFFFFIFGLFIQVQAFPFLGGLSLSSTVSLSFRVLIGQIYPSWAVFSVLSRLCPELSFVGMSRWFGYLFFGSAILTAISGLLETEKQKCLQLWITSGIVLSFALLTYTELSAAVALLFCVSICGLCLSIFLEENSFIVPFLSFSSATGMVGFVSAHSLLKAIEKMSEERYFFIPLGFYLAGFFLFSLLGWRSFWRFFRSNKSANETSWFKNISSFFLVFLSSGLFWTGTFSGQVFPANIDRFSFSLFELFFENFEKVTVLQESSFPLLSVSLLHWGALFFSMSIAYWIFTRGKDPWLISGDQWPILRRLLGESFLDRFLLSQFFLSVGRFSSKAFDNYAWAKLSSQKSPSVLCFVSNLFLELDYCVFLSLEYFIKNGINILAKALQFIQNGDLKWYLFLVFSCGFGIFIFLFKSLGVLQ